MSLEETSMSSQGPTEEEILEYKRKVIEDLIWLRKECDKRCLYETAQWAEECLVNQPEDLLDAAEFLLDEPSCDSTSLELKTRFIRSLIQNKEYHRAVYHAEKLPKPLSSHHAFLLFFSSYLVCLERKAQDDPENDDYPLNHDDTFVPQLSRKIQLLRCESPMSFDCWNYYLLGLILKMTHDEKKARQAFVDAIRVDPRCWPAWESLALIIKEKNEMFSFPLPTQLWQYKLFLGKVFTHLNLLRNAVDIHEDLIKNYLDAVPYLICENASACNSLQEHASACSMFELIRKSDPYRIEQMNVYGDSLFIRQQVETLYVLGRFFEKSHKYTWQCCHILANYFSAVKQHDRAHSLLITATRLSPHNSLLWVFLGHECVELKSPTDAVSAYRKAISIDPQNYHAYYGMGQLYEIFSYPDFALRFYEQAHRCRPSDSRMLVAMGVSFYHLRRFRDAENAYVKAFRIGDIQGNALKKLGSLYEELKDTEKAAKVYLTFLRVYGEENHSDRQFIAHVCLFLAQYHFDQKRFDKADEFSQKCMADETTKEGAMKIRKEIQMLKRDT